MTETKSSPEGGFGPSVRRRRRRSGFTLTEIMIAMGVLVTGLGMVAGAFHAGIQSHQATMDEILRGIIGENALAIARVRLDTDTGLTATPQQIMTDLTGIGPDDQRYPVGGISDQGYGYIMLASQPDGDRNDCQFTIIPYRVDDPNNHLEMVKLNKKVMVSDYPDSDGSKATVSGRGAKILDYLPVGALVIDLRGGRVSSPIRVVELLDTKNVLLDRKLTGSSSDFFVLKVVDEFGQMVTDDVPDIAGVFRGRTALRATE